jgi:hypothetical protein
MSPHALQTRAPTPQPSDYALSMPTAVLLLHTLPDGTSHFDWLTARSGDAASPLIAFRVGVRIDDPHTAAFDAKRLSDHRSIYLEFEGALEPVAGRDRGAVRRLAQAEAIGLEETPGRLRVRLDWGAGPRVLEGAAVRGDLWRFGVTAKGPSGR